MWVSKTTEPGLLVYNWRQAGAERPSEFCTVVGRHAHVRRSFKEEENVDRRREGVQGGLKRDEYLWDLRRRRIRRRHLFRIVHAEDEHHLESVNHAR